VGSIGVTYLGQVDATVLGEVLGIKRVCVRVRMCVCVCVCLFVKVCIHVHI